jgi:hypothetical protein
MALWLANAPRSSYRRDFAGPGACCIDEGIGRNALSTREHAKVIEGQDTGWTQVPRN